MTGLLEEKRGGGGWGIISTFLLGLPRRAVFIFSSGAVFIFLTKKTKTNDVTKCPQRAGYYHHDMFVLLLLLLTLCLRHLLHGAAAFWTGCREPSCRTRRAAFRAAPRGLRASRAPELHTQPAQVIRLFNFIIIILLLIIHDLFKQQTAFYFAFYCFQTLKLT